MPSSSGCPNYPPHAYQNEGFEPLERRACQALQHQHCYRPQFEGARRRAGPLASSSHPRRDGVKRRRVCRTDLPAQAGPKAALKVMLKHCRSVFYDVLQRALHLVYCLTSAGKYIQNFELLINPQVEIQCKTYSRVIIAICCEKERLSKTSQTAALSAVTGKPRVTS